MSFNHHTSKAHAQNIQISPGFVDAVRAVQERPPTPPQPRLSVPRSPRYYADGVRYIQDGESANEMLDLARQRSLSHIGIDTEFRYDRPGVVIDKRHTAYDPRSVRPLLLSLALVEPDAGAMYRFVVDLRRPDVLPSLRRLLSVPCVFVGHFLLAELFCLWQLGLPEPKDLWDTWAYEKAAHLGLFHKKYVDAAHLDDDGEAQVREQAEEEEKFSLALPATCQRHAVDYRFASDKKRLQQSFLAQADDAAFTDEQIHYASADAEAAAKLYLPQVLAAAQSGLLQHLVNIEMPWVITTARMGWRGVRIDREQCQAVAAAGESHSARLTPQLSAIGIANVRSHDQLKEFFARQGLLELFRRGGKISFDKQQLETFENRHPSIPLIRAARRILDLGKDKTLTGEFEGVDGRVHPDYRQLGTATGRQSSRWPNVMGLGRVFRPLIIPEPGRGIGEVDWCQIEIGIAAAVYGDEKLIEMFNSDDVYSAMAKHVYRNELSIEDLNMPGSEFKRLHRQYRNRMKICILGIIYGFTAHGLSLQLQTTEHEAAALQQRFMGMFPDLSEALAATWCYGGLCGYVNTVSGLRRRRARKGALTNWERNWMTNHPVQGSAAVVFKAAGNRLDKLYRKYDAWLIVPMHDAFVFEAPLKALSDVAALTERVMIDAVQEYFPDLRPKVEVNIQQPQCWNKDGHADSVQRWTQDPTYSF